MLLLAVSAPVIHCTRDNHRRNPGVALFTIHKSQMKQHVITSVLFCHFMIVIANTNRFPSVPSSLVCKLQFLFNALRS